jgi:hypothetical protein
MPQYRFEHDPSLDRWVTLWRDGVPLNTGYGYDRSTAYLELGAALVSAGEVAAAAHVANAYRALTGKEPNGLTKASTLAYRALREFSEGVPPL